MHLPDAEAGGHPPFRKKSLNENERTLLLLVLGKMMMLSYFFCGNDDDKIYTYAYRKVSMHYRFIYFTT